LQAVKKKSTAAKSNTRDKGAFQTEVGGFANSDMLCNLEQTLVHFQVSTRTLC
jgi:hypothetical protein